MAHLLHLRVGGFFNAVTDRSGRSAWRRALTRPSGLAASLELTARLDELAHRHCRAVEWRTASDAWLDLESGRAGLSPWALADALYADAKALVPVLVPITVACGVASTKRGARAASRLAAPSGLVVTRPGQDTAIIAAADRVRATAGKRPLRLVTDPRDAAPFHPATAPRAIARGVDLPDGAAWPDALATLATEAATALAALDLVAGTVRLQWIPIGSARVADAFVSLPAPTAQAGRIDALARLASRSLRPAAAGRLVVSLSQLTPVLAQGALPLEPAHRRFA